MHSIKKVLLSHDTDLLIPTKWIHRSKLTSFNIKSGIKYTVISPKKQGNYPLICAHVDTVRRKIPMLRLDSITNTITGSGDILGGDDRAGVYILYSLIDSGIPAIYCLFDEEETGGAGVEEFMDNHEDIITSSTCYIGLDRRGSTDAATYSYTSSKLLLMLGDYGYKQKDGSCTDVSRLESAYPKATVNLSVGFYSEHTSNEYLSIGDMERTLENMKSIIPRTTNVFFTDIKSDTYSRKDYGMYGSFRNYGKYTDYYDDYNDFDNLYSHRERNSKSIVSSTDLTLKEVIDHGCNYCVEHKMHAGRHICINSKPCTLNDDQLISEAMNDPVEIEYEDDFCELHYCPHHIMDYENSQYGYCEKLKYYLNCKGET